MEYHYELIKEYNELKKHKDEQSTIKKEAIKTELKRLHYTLNGRRA